MRRTSPGFSAVSDFPFPCGIASTTGRALELGRIRSTRVVEVNVRVDLESMGSWSVLEATMGWWGRGWIGLLATIMRCTLYLLHARCRGCGVHFPAKDSMSAGNHGSPCEMMNQPLEDLFEIQIQRSVWESICASAT